MKNINYRVFIITFVVSFAMTGLSQAGVKLPHTFDVLKFDNLWHLQTAMKDPAPYRPLQQEVDRKLEAKPNKFSLHQPLEFVSRAQAADSLETNLPAYGVVNLKTGEVLESKNLDQPLPIASLT